MVFEQIIRKEGLYRSSELNKGCAYLIEKNSYTNSNELLFVSYINRINKPCRHPVVMTDKLMNSNFRKVYKHDDLFKEYNELTWE